MQGSIATVLVKTTFNTNIIYCSIFAQLDIQKTFWTNWFIHLFAKVPNCWIENIWMLKRESWRKFGADLPGGSHRGCMHLPLSSAHHHLPQKSAPKRGKMWHKWMVSWGDVTHLDSAAIDFDKWNGTQFRCNLWQRIGKGLQVWCPDTKPKFWRFIGWQNLTIFWMPVMHSFFIHYGRKQNKKGKTPEKIGHKKGWTKNVGKKEAGQKRCDRPNHGHQLFALGSVRLIDKRSGVLTRTCHLISSSSYFNWYLSYLSYTCCLIIDIKSITFFGWVLLGKCCFTCQKLNLSQTRLPTPPPILTQKPSLTSSFYSILTPSSAAPAFWQGRFHWRDVGYREPSRFPLAKHEPNTWVDTIIKLVLVAVMVLLGPLVLVTKPTTSVVVTSGY